MDFKNNVESVLERMQSRSEAGFAVGLHLAFTTSKYIIQTYPAAWMEEYSQKGFLLADPTVRWGVENLGWVRWDDLRQQDDAGIIDAAASFGLTHGLSIAVERGGSRSLGSFAAKTVPFAEPDIAELTACLEELHDLTQDIESGSPSDALMQRVVSSQTSVS